ncbi:Exonuclease 1 [Vitis vinifera]|uniref:Exonuclease 1 n=1 Tax=Vitis vinifera TaxID=29760 RepID=A0A438D290_VITVI|nr:Exonuclease 1 [Vitis vinifera]
MRRFSEVIDDLDLRDLPLQGGPFTWSGGLNSQTMSRLDRFLVTEDWEGYFNGVVQSTLPRPMSDHFPILLDEGGVRRGLVPFRFENMWLKEEGFKDLLKGWWQGLRFSGSFSFILAEKLKALKEKRRILSIEELEARKEAKGDFEKWVLMEEISWRQKSREVWLKEGDKNTGFFHKMANSHRRKNCLSKIKVNGTWIDGEEAARLEEAFTEEEVFSALLDLNGDKAPGPDRFSLSFWQFSWDFVKEEVMGFLKEFHEHGRFVRSLNSTFLVLIPKKTGAEDLRDFRPISLVGGLYKLLAKVLVNRLKKVMGKVVSSAQNAFVEGRQILDAVLIANEAIDSMLKRNESGLQDKRKKRRRDFAISGLRINLDKSEILPVGRVENLEVLALEVGCKVGRLPTSYLGIPLGANHKSVAIWDGVEERFWKRLAMWKRQFISKGGRMTLIHSTLSRGALERKPHLVKWDTVCLDKRKGGLGVRRLSTLNRALLCKWNWRFANERDTLWRCVISRKFGEEEGSWYTKDVREGFGVGFWKDIRKEGALLQNKVGFSMGNGRRVKFWKDNWCRNFTLCNSFPSLYAFATYKEAWLEELWDHSGGEGVWSPNFSKPFNDWEVEEVEGLLLTIRGANFASTQKEGRCLANRCFLCCEEEESIDHILIQCSRARVLWELLFALFGVTWVLPYSVRDTLSGWCGFNLGKKRRKVLKQENVSYIVAPYEADAQMTFLAVSQQVDAIITEDSDMIPFGCPRIIFKMDKFGQGVEFKYSMIQQNKELSFAGFTKQMILEMCILSGCDYLQSLPGMGLKKAHALIKKFKSYDKVIKHLRYATGSVPPLYEESFKKAMLTFQHQRVYDPTIEDIVHLSVLSDNVDRILTIITLISQDIAKGIATGDLDPFTKMPFQGQNASDGLLLDGTYQLESFKPESERKKIELPAQKNLLTNYFCFTSLEAKGKFRAPRITPNDSNPVHGFPPTTCLSASVLKSGNLGNATPSNDSVEDVGAAKTPEFIESASHGKDMVFSKLGDRRSQEHSLLQQYRHSIHKPCLALHKEHECKYDLDAAEGKMPLLVNNGDATDICENKSPQSPFENNYLKSAIMKRKPTSVDSIQPDVKAKYMRTNASLANRSNCDPDIDDTFIETEGGGKFGSNISHLGHYSDIAEKSMERFVSVLSSFNYSSGSRASGLRAPLRDVQNIHPTRSTVGIDVNKFAYVPNKMRTASASQKRLNMNNI